MTKKELSQLYYLNREIEQDKHRLAELEAAATSTTSHITGLPHTSGITDKTALAAAIADARDILEQKQLRCIQQYNDMMRWISEIDDSMMRQIITLRCVNGLNWRQVAFSIGGGNTEDGVRKAFARFVKE